MISHKEREQMPRYSPALVTALLLGFAAAALAGSINGKVTATGLRSNADVVVYIEKIEGKTFPPPEKPVVMDQKGKLFVPKILPVVVGTKVDFLNSDAFAHNVFTPDKCADKFDLGSWPTGETRSYTFKKPCAAVMLCNVHPEMVAYIVAVETPYFAVTDTDGSFTIKDVPDGTYTVSAWHERLKKQSQEVTVNGATTIDVTLTR
jgi:plastocyanin